MSADEVINDLIDLQCPSCGHWEITNEGDDVFCCEECGTIFDDMGRIF